MARKKTTTSLSLQEQADRILKEAEEKGVATNYFFRTTFERYQTQLRILDELRKTIDSEGPLVIKEYVKGRGNSYVHPAITEYNKTTTAANQTVITLTKIIDSFAKSSAETKPTQSRLDKLLAAAAD